MYKILVCGMTPNLGGIEKVVFNFYQKINKDEFHFDFICLGDEKIGFSDEIDALSKNPVRYFNLPKRKENPVKFKKELEKIFKEHAHEYSAIWVNLCMLSNIEYLKLAKKYGIKKRIVHSHNGDENNRGIRYLLHRINRRLIKQYATDFWACSDEAAHWFYTPKTMKKYKFIRNAINIEEFLFDGTIRKNSRLNLGLSEDDIVIGNVGRISFQKNQEFAIEVLNEVIKKEKRAKLVLVGGRDNSQLVEQVKKLGLEDKVIFTGMRDDVPDLYNAFDFFILPSRYEGLPVVLLEAQANGLPILASDTITEQAKISDSLEYLPLSIGENSWAENIIKRLENSLRGDKKVIRQNFSKKGFILEEETKRLEELFKEGLV